MMNRIRVLLLHATNTLIERHGSTMGLSGMSEFRRNRQKLKHRYILQDFLSYHGAFSTPGLTEKYLD